MWRAFFIAVGISALLMGLEAMAIDKAILHSKAANGGLLPAIRAKEIIPPDWAPWSLLSIGAITVLYSFTIPGRKAH
ncbi:MAG: hypothetical protein JSS27_17760 [Planctomycetes bacterium]|nr:hypothetical protein [Planctomycetota bacterium]